MLRGCLVWYDSSSRVIQAARLVSFAALSYSYNVAVARLETAESLICCWQHLSQDWLVIVPLHANPAMKVKLANIGGH